MSAESQKRFRAEALSQDVLHQRASLPPALQLPCHIFIPSPDDGDVVIRFDRRHGRRINGSYFYRRFTIEQERIVGNDTRQDAAASSATPAIRFKSNILPVPAMGILVKKV